MTTKRTIAHNLAAAFLAGPWTVKDLAQRGAQAWGSRPRWLRILARRVLATFPDPPCRDDGAALTEFIDSIPTFSLAWEEACQDLSPRQVFWVTSAMNPAPGRPTAWGVPALASSGAVAEWLGIQLPELDWFADCRGRKPDVPCGPLRHYTYQWLNRPGRQPRLLEMPKQRLKAIQRRVLHEILDRIPPHDAAHGYRRGRSIRTAIGPHTSRAIVLRFDLRAFFPSIHSGRVHALFRTAGYPPGVARGLPACVPTSSRWTFG
jgi:hypothetical protein